MEDLSTCYEIARLIAAEIAETITPQEKTRLDSWLGENERHVETYRQIRTRLEKGENDNSFRKAAIVQKDMKKVKGKLFPRKSPFIGYRFFSYAAVVILLIGLTVNILQKQEKREVVELAVLQDSIQPGSSKAVLTLSDGKQVYLENLAGNTLQKDGMLLREQGGELLYEQAANMEQPDRILYNTITIPRSGEYKLVLSDGTRVWLNSDSELKYPLKFTGNSRRVTLRGEAYFEVTADTTYPFIVETADINVKVLGTGFNVAAYPGDAEATVTLVHGKVGVWTAEQQVVLKPEEQYVYQPSTNRGTVRKVDVSYYTGWKEGVLNFDSMPMDELVTKLSRWYDVDFFFTSEQFKHLKFSGAFKKYNNIHYVLNIIEGITDVKFDIKGRIITIR